MVPTSGVTSDDTNWIVSLPVSCEASAVSVCKLAGSQVTASITTRNNLYVSVIRNSLQVSVQYLANAIVDTLPLTLPIYRPISISGAVLKRNESRAGQPVALTLSFDSPALPAVNVVITTQGWSMPILTSGTTPASATLTSPTVSSTPLGACTFRSNSITVSCPATNGSQLLTLFGINNLLAPLTA